MKVPLTSNIERLLFLGIFHGVLLSATASGQRPLEGVELRCCTLIESPVVFVDRTRTHTHGFDGMAIDYLNVLEARLGFKCKTLDLFKASKPENQGFTGFVFELEECTQNGSVIDSPNCQCDIGVGGWARNSERHGRVEFLPTFVNDDFRMLTHVDNLSPGSARGAFFITAFSLTTWTAVIGLIICFIFLKLFDRKFVPPDPNLMNLPNDVTKIARLKHYLTKTKLSERLKRATKNTLLEIIGQSTDEIHWDSTSNRQWLTTYFILLCGLFLVLSYEATMTASLVQETAIADFRNLDDLKECRIPAKDVCIPKGGAAHAFWESTIAISPCHDEGSSASLVETYDEGHAKVASKQCKYFLASGATTKNAANRRYCGQVATSGEPFFLTGSSYLLPKGSNMTDIFSRVTLQLRVEDALKSIDRYIRSKGGECQTSEVLSLSFNRLKIFFLSAYAVCTLLFFSVVFHPNPRDEGTRQKSSEPKDVGENGDLKIEVTKLDSYSEASYSLEAA